jgi:hypothetical protein
MSYEVVGEQRVPQDFIEAIYRTLLAGRKKIHLVAKRINVDDLTAHRGAASTQIEFDFYIVSVDHPTGEISVGGHMNDEKGQWILIQTNTEENHVRFDIFF